MTVIRLASLPNLMASPRNSGRHLGLPQDPSQHGKRVRRPPDGSPMDGSPMDGSPMDEEPDRRARNGRPSPRNPGLTRLRPSLSHYVHGAPVGQRCSPGNGFSSTHRGSALLFRARVEG